MAAAFAPLAESSGGTLTWEVRDEPWVRGDAGAFNTVAHTAEVRRPEGGSGYSDAEVYERRSLGGGLGYSAQQLREIWSPQFEIEELATMQEHGPPSPWFGRDFLWTMRARRR